MRYLLGIDAGTTSFKGILYDENGNVRAKASEDYVLLTPFPGRVELDPEEYWRIFGTITKKLIHEANIDVRDIKALAIDSQGETLISIDKDGRPLRNAIVWLDNRSEEEARLIEEHFNISKVYEVTGQPEVAATWPATKILWLKKNEPEVFKHTDKYLLLEDYLIYKLTGNFVSEKSLLSSTIYFNIHSGNWWKEMLDFIGISEEQLPVIKDSAERVGFITNYASEQTGLCTETIVVTGALDQAAGMIGAGNITSGIVTETTGACFAMCINVDTTTALTLNAQVPLHCHALNGQYYLIFWTPTAGLALKWFKNNFFNNQLNEEDTGYDVFKAMDAEAEKVMPGSDGLITLPYMSGTGFPEYNPFAKGVFYGFTLGHGRGHFIRSILESIAYILKNNIEMIERSGINVQEIRSMGGGAKSKLWNAIKADVTGKSIVILEDDETACLGAAILAGVGAGVFSSVKDACDRIVGVKEKFNPDSTLKWKDAYENGYKTYLKLYNNLESMFRTEP